VKHDPSDWPLEDLWLSLRDIRPEISIECLPEIDSTNTELARRVRQGHVESVLLAAERQTAGRGRLGKPWVTPAGSALTFSIGLPLNPPDWSGLSLAVGLALVETLDPQGELGLGLKWPNDLWHWPRPGAPSKLGGILVETLPLASPAQGRYAIVGVGVNCRTPEIDTGSIAPRGLDHWGEPPLPGALLARLAPPLWRLLNDFEASGAGPALARYAERDLLLNQAIQTSQGMRGIGRGIDPQGALRLQTEQGLVRIESAEVSVRPLESSP
jgi:BirA family biotin operon repressor/biotin-[acetyl-CoA-carboxylase] ligase